MKSLQKFAIDDLAATAVEYALIASITAVVIIAGLSLMNDSVLEMYTTIGGAITKALGG